MIPMTRSINTMHQGDHVLHPTHIRDFLQAGKQEKNIQSQAGTHPIQLMQQSR